MFLLLLGSGLGSTVFGQTYNNEWIVNGRTYYKFKIAEDGLY